MPVELLIHAFTHRKAKKGAIQHIQDDSVGVMEGYKNYIVLRISDATKDDVKHFLRPWKTNFQYELVRENANGRRYKIKVSPRVIAEFGGARAIKTKLRDLLVDQYGATVRQFKPADGYITVDIPNTDWQELKNAILDQFEEQLSQHSFLFDEADVDAVVAAGGKITRTKAQVMSKIRDRRE